MFDEQDNVHFNANIVLLRECNPNLAFKLENLNCKEPVFYRAFDGSLNLQKVETFFYSSGIEEAEKWAMSLDLNDTNVLIVYGIGLGYYYDAVKRWLHEGSDRYLVFIDDDLNVFYRFLETKRASEILSDTRVQIYYFNDVDDECLRHIVWFFTFLKIEVSALEYYQRTRKEDVWNIHSRIMGYFFNHNNLVNEYVFGGLAFFCNFYPNLFEINKAYHGNKMFGRFKNIPAIICGAGPSLDCNLSLLETLTNRAIIFAGGSAVNALSKHGFCYHLGAYIDPNKEQLHRIETNWAFETPVCYRNRLNNWALKNIHSARLFINGCGGYNISRFFEERFGIEDNYELDEGNNVINWCLSLANLFGCNPIIFTGMDLAFTNMQRYASNVTNDNDMAVDTSKEHHFDGKSFFEKRYIW